MKRLIFTFLIIHCSLLIVKAQWMQQISGTSRTLYDIEFLNKNTGWVVGVGGTIRKTTNGGINWDTISHPVGNKLLSSIHLIDSNYAYIVGDFETIIKTTDGGNSWIIIRNGPTGQGKSYEGVFFINKDTGWICGSGQYILKTTNGGNNFDSSYLNWGILTDLFFKDSNTGVMCGWTGGTFKTSNSGTSWFRTQIDLPTNQPSFRKVSFINSDTGWIVGGDGRVFRTIDCGSVWDSVAFLNTLPSVMYCTEFANFNTGWVAGEFGIIYKTTNSGQNWGQQFSNTNNLITSMWVYNDSLGWVSCGFGGIMHTINGGLTSINEQTEPSNDFELSQNYPNPFNPFTFINYELRSTVHVVLKIYNVMGREIQTLVNQKQNSGKYQIKFNGEGLPSGFYYYRISTEGVSETKKMILQK